MGRVRLLTVVALLVLDCELHDESLLQHGVGLDFFLDGEFDLDSF